LTILDVWWAIAGESDQVKLPGQPAPSLSRHGAVGCNIRPQPDAAALSLFPHESQDFICPDGVQGRFSAAMKSHREWATTLRAGGDNQFGGNSNGLVG
jgi:hypothetical protein